MLQEEALGLDEVLHIIDEASHVIAYSRELEQKSRELEHATAELRDANIRADSVQRLLSQMPGLLISGERPCDIIWQGADIPVKVIGRHALLMCAAVMATQSAPAAAPQDEIDHLIAYVERSHCRFVRNGVATDSTAAAAHLRRKYRYAKGRITSADEFIDQVASSSSMTGKPYLVQCQEQPAEESRLWLHKELTGYRAKHAGSSGGA